MLTKIFQWLGLAKRVPGQVGVNPGPRIYHRSQHTLSRSNISKHALKVLYHLRDAGFQAYLVGGGVRDVLLGLHPKDFDVATDALPEEVQTLFRNCRLIGRRFRLAHVHFGGHIVEVATFRASHSEEEGHHPHLSHSNEGMILRDNIYGSLEEDVLRRDFTVNALYYNIADYSVLDFMGGMKDLKARCLRMVGDAKKRYREDPVRMLRAVRFAAKLNFHIHPETETPIYEMAHLVSNVPSARLFDEYLKLFLSGFALDSFKLLRKYGLLGYLFPQTEKALQGPHHRSVEKLIYQALENTDKRVNEDRPVAPPFLLAIFLWHPVQAEMQIALQEQGTLDLEAFFDACQKILNQQQSSVAIPRRLILIIREIWMLQFRLEKAVGRRIHQVFTHPRFRAGYDFLLLRAAAGDETVEATAQWWTTYVSADEEAREALINQRQNPDRKRKRKPKFRRSPKNRAVE